MYAAMQYGADKEQTVPSQAPRYYSGDRAAYTTKVREQCILSQSSWHTVGKFQTPSHCRTIDVSTIP